MVNSKDLILTKEGLENLKKEYRHLIDVERPAVIEQLQNARGMGDLSENADYDAARNKQAEIEGRIKEIEAILADAKIATSSKKDASAKISSVVTFKDLSDGKIMTVRLVSSIESNPLSDPNDIKISNVCALGAALIGHNEGEILTVKANKPYEIEILEIR